MMNTTTKHHRTVLFTVFFVFAGILIPALMIAPQAISASEEFIATKLEDIAGIWEAQHGGRQIYVQYRTDGTYSVAYALENLQSSPWSSGRFWFEGNVYFQKGEHPLSPDFPGKYEVHVHQKEGMLTRLSLKVIDDASAGRVKDLTAGMTRVEPLGKIVNTAEELVGIWETMFMGKKAYSQYEADGAIRLAYDRENLQTSPVHTSYFWFEGNVYYGEADSLLTKGLPGKYEVRLHTEAGKPDRLSFRVIGDANTYRVKDLTAGMTRAEP